MKYRLSWLAAVFLLALCPDVSFATALSRTIPYAESICSSDANVFFCEDFDGQDITPIPSSCLGNYTNPGIETKDICFPNGGSHQLSTIPISGFNQSSNRVWRCAKSTGYVDIDTGVNTGTGNCAVAGWLKPAILGTGAREWYVRFQVYWHTTHTWPADYDYKLLGWSLPRVFEDPPSAEYEAGIYVHQDFACQISGTWTNFNDVPTIRYSNVFQQAPYQGEYCPPLTPGANPDGAHSPRLQTGRWYTIELHYKLGTDAGTGRMRLWIDDILTYDFSRPTCVAPCADLGYIYAALGFMNPADTATGYAEFDNLVYSRAKIGLPGGGAPAPSGTIDYVASKNSTTATAKAVLGRTSTTGAVELKFTRLDTASYLIGSGTVRVVAERIPDNGTSALASLTGVINADYPVVGNTITIILPTFGATEAYIVTLTTGTGGSPPSPVSTTDNLTIDMSLDGGPVTYRGSGFLHHGILAASPSDALTTPMKTKMVRCGAVGAKAVCKAVYSRVSGLGAKLQLLLSDNFYQAPWPGDGGNWTNWENQCKNKVNASVTAGRTFEWDIWNEPNQTNPFWGAAGGQSQWFEAWKRCFNIIRGILPGAVIVGPSVGPWDQTYIEQFLSYAQANNVLPNRLSWHAFYGGPEVQTNVAAIRAYMSANGIPAIPISINEYAGPTQFTAPGPIIHYLAAFERAQVDSASHACWDDAGTDTGNACFNTPATLNGLLTTNGLSARSSWWAHKGYGDLSGRMVGFTATGSPSGLVVSSRRRVH